MGLGLFGFILFAIVGIPLIKYNPSLDKVNGEYIIWYSESWYTNERKYIFVKDIFNKF